MIDFPPIEELVPHAAPMLLLDRVIESGEDYLVAELTVRLDGMFDDEGFVPALVGIEYMAQSIAAFSGLRSRVAGEPAKLGFLLGTRRFESNVHIYTAGDILRVCVTQIVYGDSGMAAFECKVEGHEVLQTAILTVYEPSDAANLAEVLGT
ncbi:MAG: hypothetical protein KDI33_21230 [Halioglobus sp.]|nr:hypothetical protein [Halioglobus sp.]